MSWDDGEVLLVHPPPQFRLLAEAIETRQRLCILYEKQDGHLVDLPLTPSFLINSRGREYLGAFCHIVHALKTYRLDRVRRVRR
jgi:predicted DNA-binding transcriptional regulator YafY